MIYATVRFEYLRELFKFLRDLIKKMTERIPPRRDTNIQ